MAVRAVLLLFLVMLSSSLRAQSAHSPQKNKSVATTAPCTPAPPDDLDAILWSQGAAEHRALALQAYHLARALLSRGVSNPHWVAAGEQPLPSAELPPAVVFDLDETLLDNTRFQVRLHRAGGCDFQGLWNQWITDEQADALPGGVEFVHYAVSLGVAPYYITNRVCDPTTAKDPTVDMLRKLQLPFSPDRLLCKKDGDSSDKSARRLAVASTHRILLLFGDDLGDFTSVPTGITDPKELLAARERIVNANRELWGERWIVLPNPMYGSWFNVFKDRQQRLDALIP